MSKILRVREEWKNAPFEQTFIWEGGKPPETFKPEEFPFRYLKAEDWPNNPVQIFEEVEVP